MIDKVYQAGEDLTSVQKALDSVHEQAAGIITTETEPTVDDVPNGKYVVYDNGTDRRVYFRTGKEGVGYFTLTMI